MEILLPLSTGWMALGFSSPGATASTLANTVGAFQLHDDGFARSHGNDLTVPLNYSPTGLTHNLEIILTTGATLDSSSLEFFVDGTSVRSGVAVDATSIDGIFLAHESPTGQFRGEFDRLLLQGPIPEPSAVMMFVLGGLGAVMRRKR